MVRARHGKMQRCRPLNSIIERQKNMNSHVKDYYPLLEAAIAEAKAAGLGAAASKLEARAFSAYTTSSELLGEHGIAIREFLRSDGAAVPPTVKAKLDQCLKQIRKVWPRL